MFHRDALISTVFTFLLIGLLGLIAANTKYLSPIYNALKDFEYTDLYYSQYKAKQVAYNEDIVLVNIGDADREGIAAILTLVQSMNPKAVGVDVAFVERRDAENDSLLRNALPGDAVLASQLNYTHSASAKGKARRQLYEEKTHPYFEVRNEGYGNFVAEEGKTVRYFKPATVVQGDTVLSFVGQLLKGSNPAVYRAMMERKKETEIINYSDEKFVVLDPSYLVVNEHFDKLIAGKYVFVGYLGDGNGTGSMEDLHLTPLNKSFGGHSIPDMYGLEIHAHILNMALRGTYVNSLPRSLSWVLAFIITLLHMYIFLRDFVDNHMWFHLIAKVLQLTSFGLMFLLAIGIYHFGNLKIEPSLLLIAIVLSVDALYFLDGIMKWLYKKFHWQSYFIVEH